MNASLPTVFALAASSALAAPALQIPVGPVPVEPVPADENVIVIVIDDIGVDRIRAYASGNPSFPASITPNTQVIDQLAAEGVLFERAWAQPYCSPARAAALTGFYPNQTGIGHYVAANGGQNGCVGLNENYETLADLLPDRYSAGVAGKWHLSKGTTNNTDTGGPQHPGKFGFDFVAGTLGNINPPRTYTNWPWISVATVDDGMGGLTIDVSTGDSTQYATTVTTDDAIDAIQLFGDDPFLLWVSYNTVHKPLHVPDPNLAPPGSGYEFLGQPLNANEPEISQAKAMIEALDFEIGNLLAAIPPDVRARTNIVLFGDNGSQKDIIEAPFQEDHGKATAFRGGVQVPFIISGPRVSLAARGSHCEALIDLTDLLPTVGEMTGSATPQPPMSETLMGQSLVPYLSDPARPSDRDWIFAERFRPNYDGYDKTDRPADGTLWHRTIRNDRFKLIRQRRMVDNNDFCSSGTNPGTMELLYDLEGDGTLLADSYEQRDLIAAAGGSAGLSGAALAAYDQLSCWLDELEHGREPTLVTCP